ncbi:MAG: endo-1,4-beta-xylanase [Ruminiclostridium sp.]|nr:endo-1,4-beta-xylanase [Ruminiclostridium sp.]
MRKLISSSVALLLVLALSSCSGGAQKPDAGAVGDEAANAGTTAAAPADTRSGAPDTTAVTEELSNDMQENNGVPSINEDFAGGELTAVKRGSAILSIVQDDAAKNGRALFIEGRKESWNGADYKAELFRGNEIEVKGSFRSANKAVRVSVQFNVRGNTTYNMVFAVNTNDSTYTAGSGKYTIPASAERIVVYIESDELKDIYCDEFSVNVCGDYTYYEEAAEALFANTSEYPSLRDTYADLFRIGMAVSPAILSKPQYAELVKAQCSSITAENDMKPEAILDYGTSISDLDKYQEAPAMKFDHLNVELGFARDNGMTVRGHTLVWHSQTPEWLFYKDYDRSGELADRELMLKRMENYIKGMMEWTTANYPGLISAWDVVNEAAADEGGMRKSLWYQTVGEDYIEKAFEYARKYAPEDAKLFYNDYNSYQKKKQEDILTFLRPVAAAGNIDGVGMQSHIGTYMSINEYMLALKKYVEELGVEIHITELDIGADKSDDWEEKQGKYFSRFMKKIIELKNEGVPITSLTLWGISDSLSWKAGDRPLVFRDDLSRKPAFDAMINARAEE